MKKYLLISLIIILSLIFVNLIPAMRVTAQEPVAFGEIKSSGVVQIESSTGKWVVMRDVYPLFKNTKLTTNEGIVSINTKDGSKIDLSRNTEAAIDVLDGSYTVKLTNGTLSFSVNPSASLTITTGQAAISVIRQVGGYFSLVAGPGAPAFTNVQGMVVSGEKGTLIRSISGKISVNVHGLQPRTLNAGETLFASLEGRGDKGIIAGGAGNPVNYSNLYRGMILGAFFTTGTITAFDAFRGGGIASPSGF